jgi:hypothetical protein
MPRKDRVSRAVEMAREASETHELAKRNVDKDRVMSRAADMAREVSETHVLVKGCRGRTGWWAEQQRWQGKRLKLTFWWKNGEEGQGDEQSRDGKGSVWNPHSGERMPRKDRVSRAAEMAREASETHELVKRNADKWQGDE